MCFWTVESASKALLRNGSLQSYIVTRLSSYEGQFEGSRRVDGSVRIVILDHDDSRFSHSTTLKMKPDANINRKKRASAKMVSRLMDQERMKKW